MSELADIRPYIKKMAYLTSLATDMEVLVCDKHLRILADYRSSDGAVKELFDAECISSGSVLTKAVTTGRQVVCRDTKSENPGCRCCARRETCNAESIVAYPLLRGEAAIGAMGIYSNEQRQKGKLMYQGTEMLEFIQSIGELIITRLAEEEEKDILKKESQLMQPVKQSSFDEIIGTSPLMMQVKEEAKRFAGSTSSILIQGESGTGKEIFANAIHQESGRRNERFVAVNCAAIPDNLLESELFGYEEGAFTGAVRGGRMGKFELASRGTIFLDEIGELPIHLQPKLLRAIQERKIQRVGSNKWIDVDIRIISATNRNLPEMIKTGEFREDLYYRLGVIPLEIPPLRQRKEDIAQLAGHFLSMYCYMLKKSAIRGFSEDALSLLEGYSWPGNVRELQNTVEYAVNTCTSAYIGREELLARLRRGGGLAAGSPVTVAEAEKAAILNALNYYGRDNESKTQAAKKLGISRATLYRKIKEYQL